MKVTFMFGLPGSGKSTWIKNNMPGALIVSADTLKESHPSYDPKNPQDLHQWSVEEAEKRLGTYFLEGFDNIVFDGGGINNSYNKRLAKLAEKYHYKIDLVVMNVPAEVCINRNNARERNVPVEAIVEKAVMFNKCLAGLIPLVDEVIYVNYFTNKNIFVDMDGTIAAYQHLPVDKYNSIDFINGEHFKHSLPVKPILDKLQHYATMGSNIYVLSATPDNLCQQDKIDWLKKHAPFIPESNYYFIGNKRWKHVMLRNIVKKMKLKTCDVTMVDDEHQVLDELATIGINPVHVSMFLTESF